MPVLLLREASTSSSLSALVEKAQKRTAPLLEYHLQLQNGHLNLVRLSHSTKLPHVNSQADEGFESDIDNLSLVSSDNDSFTEKAGTKITETDSANGSSDSDTEASDLKAAENALEKLTASDQVRESFNLVDCVCYTDVKCNDILIFVIKNEALVFRFDNVTHLQSFYRNFTALKAVTNQKLYNKNFATKFSLLQRTDQNGVTHIEITREPEPRHLKSEEQDRVEYSRYRNDEIKSSIGKSNSIESILDVNPTSRILVNENSLRKVWNSAEDLLEPPKRPVRRKKGKAPQPPTIEKQDIYSGQYVRVNVNFEPSSELDQHRLVIKSSLNEPHPKKFQSFTSFLKSKDKQVLKYEPKKLDNTSSLGRTKLVLDNSWTNSVPRMLKKPRAKAETKNFVPMAYRYIDTTQDYPVSYSAKPARGFGSTSSLTSNQNISNRLFGLSSKLRDFPSEDSRWTDMYGVGKDVNLKSVIKNGKEDQSRKKNEKKVTFSAYTTVQVV
ncbi:unnamed protein product [Acanthoscelides obtectus]|uniref:Uncharacterized protein n=1 Tax=Acanthoscelides obtectus TaxID=200917 RepID=A0A9P0JJV9_ACAOB|nr:unnamed protein product [Acanthoscelides obtectus]CAK1639889.1 hypothetical protein AOBTE_LOCUS11434 [Acanthoscelides obtectus]